MAAANKKKTTPRPTPIYAKDVPIAPPAIPGGSGPPRPTPSDPRLSGAPPGQGGMAQAMGAAGFSGTTPTPTSFGGGMNLPVTSDLPFQGDPYTGFAGQYSPITGPQTLYGDEGAAILARDIMAGQGFTNPNAGVLPMLENYMSNFLPLALLSGGAGATNEAVFNFAGDLGQQGMRGGGAGIDSAAMLSALMAGINDPTSPIYQFIAGPGTSPEEQQRNLEWLLAAATGGLNPIAQQLYLSPLDDAMTRYQQGLAHGDMAGAGGLPFLNYVTQNQALPQF